MSKLSLLLTVSCLSLCSCSQEIHGNKLSNLTASETFLLLDNDKNGYVSEGEWNNAVQKAVAPLPRSAASIGYVHDMTTLFQNLDINHDHRVSVNEFETGKFEVPAKDVGIPR